MRKLKFQITKVSKEENCLEKSSAIDNIFLFKYLFPNDEKHLANRCRCLLQVVRWKSTFGFSKMVHHRPSRYLFQVTIIFICPSITKKYKLYINLHIRFFHKTKGFNEGAEQELRKSHAINFRAKSTGATKACFFLRKRRCKRYQ